MKKFLYITDQDEYTDHSFIGPLFKKYLRKYYEVDVVYFSDFKTDTQFKDERFVIPSINKNDVLGELERYGVDVNSYSYVVIRNTGSILKTILKVKDKYNFKIGYRFSFPKKRAKVEFASKATFLSKFTSKLETFSETQLINKCDLFMPSSQKLHETYFSDVNIKSFIIPPAIDPEVLHDNIQHTGEEKRFFFCGALDKIREFNIVLEAFANTKGNFTLMLATEEEDYAKKLIAQYPSLRLGENVKFFVATTKEELLALIAQADIGVSILPDISLFNTSTPVKVLNYYSSAVPSIMTANADTLNIFTDDFDAWFCKFDVDSITQKLETIISLSKDEVSEVGIKGQKRLLDIRNNKSIARNMHKVFESIK